MGFFPPGECHAHHRAATAADIPKRRPRCWRFCSCLKHRDEPVPDCWAEASRGLYRPVGHESGQLTRLVENLNYSADVLRKTWPSRFDVELAKAVARKPEQIANIAYGNRMGNTVPGDGWRYRGRGLIQITGKNNYRSCGEVLGLDLIAQPELLEKPQDACMSAALFWSSRGLNTLADAGKFNTITSRINGGQNGAADRQELYARALKVLE